MAGRHCNEHLQDPVAERLQVDHVVRGRPDGQYAQAEVAEILLMGEASIHAQPGVAILASVPERCALPRSRPNLGLQAADVVAGQRRAESPWRILVKQNAHVPE